jgi:CBS domain-containing protein
MRRVHDIVRNQNPLTLPPSTPVAVACERMRERKVGAVLVTDQENRLLGIFTGRDAIGRVLAARKDPERTTLAEVMTAAPRALTPPRSAIDALRVMHDVGCRHVPIVDGDKVVGVVSRFDFHGTEIDRLDEETGLWERI